MIGLYYPQSLISASLMEKAPPERQRALEVGRDFYIASVDIHKENSPCYLASSLVNHFPLFKRKLVMKLVVSKDL
jgi:hypothetical protein